MLSGCNLTDNESVDTALSSMSRFNDRVQGWLFNPNAMAPTYPESMITRPFPFNAFYGIEEAPTVNEESYRLEVTGLVADKRSWRLEELRAMAQTDQITRHICVEGWSAIGRWGGVRFSDFLKRVGADTDAKYVGFKCADDYYTSIDMATALHAQTLLALTYDGAVLPREYGFPMKLRMPTKLGYKNPNTSRRFSSATPTAVATGKTRATTGLVAADGRPATSFVHPPRIKEFHHEKVDHRCSVHVPGRRRRQRVCRRYDEQ